MKKYPILRPLTAALLATTFSCGTHNPAERPEKTLIEPVSITAGDRAGTLILTTSTPDWQLYRVKDDLSPGEKVALAENGEFDRVDPPQRALYLAISEGDSVYVALRHIAVEGAENIRDVGGLFTQRGEQVRWGLLYRSGSLSEIEEDDFDRLAALNIKTICDFRTDTEVTQDPDQWPNLAQIRTVRLPIGNDSLDSKTVMKQINEPDFDADRFMEKANREFVLLHSDRFRAFMSLVLEKRNYPLLYHCSAGKDRTGIASALILSALGVERASIMQEYLLSNYYLHAVGEDKLQQAAIFYDIDQDKLRALMNVKANYIQAAFSTIDSLYGGVDQYLCQQLGVCKAEVAQLKRQLLYPHHGAGRSAANRCQDTLGIELPEDCEAVPVSYLLTGAPNFRPITPPVGGSPTLKENALFRSDALHELTDQDVAYLEKLRVKTIVDFRYDQEITDDPDRPIASVTQRINPVIGRGLEDVDQMMDEQTYANVRTWFIAGEFDKVDSVLQHYDIDMAQSRKERYASFATDYTQEFGTFMKTLTEADNYPVVFHCQGGKDRTGFAAALLLKTVGFSEEDIVRDYLTTNLYAYDQTREGMMHSPQSLLPSIGAHREQLEAAMEAIDEKYGSFARYLRQGLGLSEADVAAIKENVLAQ